MIIIFKLVDVLFNCSFNYTRLHILDTKYDVVHSVIFTILSAGFFSAIFLDK
jgi:hypothetical protein